MYSSWSGNASIATDAPCILGLTIRLECFLFLCETVIEPYPYMNDSFQLI